MDLDRSSVWSESSSQISALSLPPCRSRKFLSPLPPLCLLLLLTCPFNGSFTPLRPTQRRRLAHQPLRFQHPNHRHLVQFTKARSPSRPVCDHPTSLIPTSLQFNDGSPQCMQGPQDPPEPLKNPGDDFSGQMPLRPIRWQLQPPSLQGSSTPVILVSTACLYDINACFAKVSVCIQVVSFCASTLDCLAHQTTQLQPKLQDYGPR